MFPAYTFTLGEYPPKSRHKGCFNLFASKSQRAASTADIAKLTGPPLPA